MCSADAKLPQGAKTERPATPFSSNSNRKRSLRPRASSFSSTASEQHISVVFRNVTMAAALAASRRARTSIACARTQPRVHRAAEVRTRRRRCRRRHPHPYCGVARIWAAPRPWPLVLPKDTQLSHSELHDHVTLEGCAAACASDGAAIARIEGGNHCSCGHAIGRLYEPRPLSECLVGQCSMAYGDGCACTGAPHSEKCGA